LLVGLPAVAGCADRGDDAARGSTATLRNDSATTTPAVPRVDEVESDAVPDAARRNASICMIRLDATTGSRKGARDPCA
jgi:hypothetical protein